MRPPEGELVEIIGGKYGKYRRGWVHSYTPCMVYLVIEGLVGERITKQHFIRRIVPSGETQGGVGARGQTGRRHERGSEGDERDRVGEE